jgi:YidC/Oxa1 family membrane protein insertase|tara:strand:- start:5030 stop:6760 length:1731 start_codon:yes stop_codon:yes gene_type:complete
MNPETRNLVLAISLSMTVLIGYQLFFVDPVKVNKDQYQQENIAKNLNDSSNIPIPSSGNSGVLNSDNDKTIEVKSVPRVSLISKEVAGSISLRGARIDDITLTQYRETLDPESSLINLLLKSNESNPYFITFGWSSPDNVKVPDGKTLWKSSKGVLSPDTNVTLSWDNGEGITFYQDISIDDTFMFTVNQRVLNNSKKSITLYPYGLIRRTGEPDTTKFFVLHEGPLGVFDGTLSEKSYEDLSDAGKKGLNIKPTEAGGWIGLTDKYWMTALLPDQKENYNFTYRHLKSNGGQYQTDFLGTAVKIDPKSQGEFLSRSFAGAKRLALFDDYEERFNIKHFDLAIDFGWFYFLTKPFFYALSWANDYLGNFGLAILAITVAVKLVFFPLANKSYKSMAKMRNLSPEIKKLRDRVGDDRQKLNQEMMNLYKKEKVNPAAGCLPILVQIPVFFALYKVLFVSIEMRQTPFFGWIKDLSVADPTSMFNLFGLLPYSTSMLPDFLNLGVWPLLMGVTMFLQQRLNPTPPDPIQAKIFAWMPVAFTFLLATFPAGLVIYWTWNNLLSICQQWLIMNGMKKKAN